jgi:hypothetical protein
LLAKSYNPLILASLLLQEACYYAIAKSKGYLLARLSIILYKIALYLFKLAIKLY